MTTIDTGTTLACPVTNFFVVNENRYFGCSMHASRCACCNCSIDLMWSKHAVPDEEAEHSTVRKHCSKPQGMHTPGDEFTNKYSLPIDT
jgi:hypothetical protein